MKSKLIIIIITLILIIFVVAAAFFSNNENNLNNNVINRNSKEENIVFGAEKVNIYFFWGKGCPHCEEAFEFFESINDEYNKYYNIYAFEVWFNQDNAKLMKRFAEAMDDIISGVPYTIIGEKTFSGFDNSMKNEFKKVIKKQAFNSFDVYKKIKIS